MSAIIHLPIFGLTLTLAVYLLALRLHERFGRHALLTPVFTTTVVVSLVLEVTGLPYAEYLEQVSVLVLLLGPATVALALPLLANARALRSSAPAVLVTLVIGSAVSVGVTLGALLLLGAPPEIVRSTLTRNVTSPVALSITEIIHGSASLAVVLTIVSGILGAVFAPWLLSLTGVRDERARGFAIGLTSHGIGTSRALAESETAGGWSSAGMVLSALSMTLALPVVAHLALG